MFFFLSGNLGLALKIFCKRLQYMGENNKIVLCLCDFLTYMGHACSLFIKGLYKISPEVIVVSYKSYRIENKFPTA